MAIVGEAFYHLRPDTTGFAEEAAGKLGKIFDAISGPVGLGSLAVGLGGVAFAIGESFESAFNKIRSSTGATEDQMGGLEDSFKKVLASGPSSMNQVADALSLVSDRTKMTGGDLDQLTDSELKLGRITGGDVKNIVDETTKVFANWGIQGIQPSKLALDELLKISQTTGVSIDTLSTAVVGKAGATFRELGVSMTSAATIMGTLEAAGVSTQPVIMGLTKAVTEAQKQGKDAHTALAELFDTIKNGTPGTARYEDAIKTLGTRGFLTLAESVKSGKITLEEFSGSMDATAGGTVDRIAKQNETLGTLFKTLKNEALVALEPIGIAFLNLANVAVRGAIDGIAATFNALRPTLDAVGQAFSDLWSGFTVGTDDVGSAQSQWAVWGATIYTWVDTIRTALSDFWSGFTQGTDAIGSSQSTWAQWGAVAYEWVERIASFFEAHWKPVLIGAAVAIGLLTAPVTTLVGGFIALYASSSTFRDVVNDIATALSSAAVVVAQVSVAIGVRLAPVMRNLASTVADLVRFFSERWAKISSTVQLALKVIEVAIAIFVGPVILAWRYFGDQIVAVLQLAWDLVVNSVQTTMRIIGDVFDFFISIFSGHWGDAWNDVKDIFGAAFDFLVSTFGALGTFVISFFSSLPGNILSALGDLAGLLIPKGLELVGGFFGGILSMAAAVGSWFVNLPQLILGYVAGAGSWLIGTGETLIGGLIGGLQSMAGSIGSAIEGVMRSGVNAIISIFNHGIDFLNSFQIHIHKTMPSVIPNIDIDWSGLGLPHIPTLHQGGVVPGPTGQEVLTRLLAGEIVLNPAELKLPPQQPQKSGPAYRDLMHVENMHVGNDDALADLSFFAASSLLSKVKTAGV